MDGMIRGRDRPALTRSQIEAGTEIYADWKSENWGEIHQDGGLGDVENLFKRLSVVFSQA